MSAFEERTQKRKHKEAFETNSVNQGFLRTIASSAQAQDTPRQFHTDYVVWLTTEEEAKKIPKYKKPWYMKGKDTVESFIKKSINNPNSALSSAIKLPERVVAYNTSIFSVATSNAGIALGCYCGAVYFITNDGEMITFYANAGAILSVAFINKGRHILAGGYDGFIRMWNTQRPAEQPIVFPYNSDGLVNTIAVHPTGWFISAGRDGKMNIWYEMMGSVQLHRVLTHNEDGKMNQSVTCVSFSPSGETFASGGNDGIVIIWDSEKLEEVGRIIHHDETKYVPVFKIGVTAIVYIDEEHIVSGGRDGRVCLWSITGNIMRVIEAKNTTVNSLAFTPTNDGILAVAYEKWGQGNLVLFDKTGRQLQSLDVGLAPKSVVFGRDGKIISGGTDGFLVIGSNTRSEYATEQVAALREGIAQSNAVFKEAVKHGLPPPPPKKGSYPDAKSSISILTRLPERAQEDVLKFVGGKQTKRKQTQTRKKRTSKRR